MRYSEDLCYSECLADYDSSEEYTSDYINSKTKNQTSTQVEKMFSTLYRAVLRKFK
jgi:hypothetical protein